MKVRITNKFISIFRWVIACTAVHLSITSASAFTAADATTALDSFNTAFYVGNSGNSYFKTSTSDSTRLGFWTSAEAIEMVIDAYQRTGNATYKSMITSLCNGFTFYHGTDWSGNSFNDDCLWACLAFVRAWHQTGNTTFANIAKSNFDMVYARAWSTDLGGGLWWTTAKTSKNACVNGPGACAAYQMYQYTADSSYLTKAQNILNWEKATLYVSTTGQVYDHINADGTFVKGATTYNQGTFIGACFYLGDTTNSTLAGDFVQSHWGTNMATPTQGGDPGGFNGICLRWMRIAGYSSSYRLAVANNAWSMRRTSDNLCWSDWNGATPTGTLYSWDCTSMVCALMNVPPG